MVMEELVLYRTYAEDDIVARAVAALEKGGIIIYPTDTVYALGADATNPAAVEAVFALKGRPRDQPLSVLVGGFAMLKRWALVSPKQKAHIDEQLPAARTFILKPKKAMLVSHGNVGFRLPDHWCTRIAETLGRPVTATSANVHAQQNPVSITELRRIFGKRVSLYIDAGKLSKLPSQIVDLTVEPPRLLRE